MGRFLVTDYAEAKYFDDPEGWMHFGHEGEWCNYLIDTELGIVVFCDHMEPEDATLTRDLQPLVRYLEELAK